MQSIYKYPIETTDFQTIEMPMGATMLSVQTQFGKPCIWATVETSAQKVTRDIRVFGTGHPLEDSSGLQYLGTYQLQEGALIFHVFEKIKITDPRLI